MKHWKGFGPYETEIDRMDPFLRILGLKKTKITVYADLFFFF
jgi:hypothetical protein